MHKYLVLYTYTDYDGCDLQIGRITFLNPAILTPSDFARLYDKFMCLCRTAVSLTYFYNPATVRIESVTDVKE